MPFSHRPSSLHQSNKPFKAKSKRSIKSLQKGKVDRSSHGKGPKSNSVAADSKVNRKNAAKVKILTQREKAKNANRMFTGRISVPKIGAIVPLSKNATAASFLGSLGSLEGCRLSEPLNNYNLNLPVSCEMVDSKQTIQWISCTRSPDDFGSVLLALDACKVADFVVFVVSAADDIDEVALSTLSAINAQGNLSAYVAVQGLADVAAKKHALLKRMFSEIMESEYSQSVKSFSQDSSSDLNGLMRCIINMNINSIRWREFRPYMVVSEVDVDTQGALRLAGHARGHPFSADRLVHIPEFGDFQIETIENLTSGEVFTNANDAEILFENDDEQELSDEEDLESVSSMVCDASGERMSNATSKQVRRLPKGTSEYQAAWIIDSEPESGDDTQVSDLSDQEDVEINEVNDRNDDEDAESENDQEQLEEYLKSRKEQLTPEDDIQFPDEVETPLDIPARFKFRDYRGLKSFRTSTWDKNENLPVDYSKIFQFQNFANTKRKLVALLEEERANVGTNDAESMDTDSPAFNGPDSLSLIRLTLRNAPAALVEHYQKIRHPLTVFGLFDYEERMSVLNMTLIKPKFRPISPCDDEIEPIENNSDIMIQCGFRRYNQKVLVSQFSNGKLHKMESFIHPGKTAVLSVYGQIHLYSEPVLFFVTPTQDKPAIFLGSGSLDSADPGRMIIERKILTGIPTRIHPSHHRNTAIIKFMFFNEEDAMYFKPIELKTKLGRRGHILSSIGTHGAMKCGFDKPLKSMDTVCLMLYKRVFPIWPKHGYKSLFGREQQEAKDNQMIEL